MLYNQINKKTLKTTDLKTLKQLSLNLYQKVKQYIAKYLGTT